MRGARTGSAAHPGEERGIRPLVLSVPFVSGMGLPPFTGTRRMPEPELIPNTSVLSAAQNPDTTEPDI